MTRKTLPTVFAACFLTIGAGTAGMAADRDSDTEATALDGAQLTLVDGIRAAERQTGGRAYDATIARKDGQIRIVVETNGPNGIQTVAIDARSGQVVATYAGGAAD